MMVVAIEYSKLSALLLWSFRTQVSGVTLMNLFPSWANTSDGTPDV